MSDLVRIFLLACCIYLSFRLGIMYSYARYVKKAMEELDKAADMLNKAFTDVEEDYAPSPNETL